MDARGILPRFHPWKMFMQDAGKRDCTFRAGVVLFWLTFSACAGQGAREFLVQNWTREHGIPGTTVTSMAQTPDGYLWLGTFAGLARFDGVRFVTWDLRQKAGVPDNSVSTLSVDGQGNLWIGTSGGHLVRLSAGRFTAYLPPSRQTADRYLQRVIDDRAGTIWALNYEGGLSVSSGDSFCALTNTPELLALVRGANGKVWAASPNQLLNSSDGQLQSVWSAEQESGFQINALAAARQDGCWMAGNGQVRLFKDGKPHRARAVLGGKEAAILGFLEDREGSLWLGTYGGGVLVLDPGGEVKRLTRDQGLPSDLVRCLFEDREGNLWAGLEGRGLARIRRAMFASYGRTEGLSDETVLSACEGDDEEIWIGTNGDGVYRVGRGEIQRFGANEGLTNEFVWSLHCDRAGKVWAGTWGDGLFRFEGGRFFNTSPEFGPATVVLALHEDRQGVLWLGQRTGPERVIECIENGKRRTLAVPGSLPRVDVRNIAETRDGSLWFGTVEEGLLRLKQGEFRCYGTNDGLPAIGISTLHVDDDGRLWVAAADAGLMILEAGKFMRVAITSDVIDRNINQITDDGLGHLWLGTRNGVVRVKKNDLLQCASGRSLHLDWRRFSKADGLPSNVCSGGGFRARDGRLWFPTLMGMAVVNPRHITPDPPPPAVMIEEAFVANKRIYDHSAPAGHSAVVKIAPGTGPLDVGFTALSFTAPERVSFRYQMLGLDDVPVEGGNTRVARYNRLPPGRYEFQVAARSEGGAWNQATSSLAIQMLPHYWQTSWFRFLGIVALLGGTAGIARIVILRRVERRVATLERQRALEAERSRISQDLHDDLGTSLMEIKFLSTVAGSPSRSPNEVRECLTDINNKSLELVKALDEIVWAVNPKNDSLPNLVNYLCLFAQEFLRTASIQCRLDVPAGLPDLPLNAEQRHTLFLVTKEALANAAKHATATEVRLRVALEDARLTLVIEDNGRGFDATASKPDRNGLRNIESRMRHLGGSARFRSVPVQGTRVELELPLR
ncbi:MAG TPA: two-component regulator propeller domain-containing protein [Verrucomicrobiae bacterium]|nr:two-component regulator propeller domain-containing protein [Verrucomicrobiae bacterium]